MEFNAFKIAQGIQDTAQSLGVDPVDLGTAMSYETAGTFDPLKKGPTTKWGLHQGFIQFGEPQAKKYGVDYNNPIESQLGENGAVAKYLKDAGVKKGMGLLDIYSAINAGSVGRYNASDAAAGGMPGTVADKVNNQMADHRKNAQTYLASNTISDDELFNTLGLTQEEAPQVQQIDISDDELFGALGLNDNAPQDNMQEVQQDQSMGQGEYIEQSGERSFADRVQTDPFIAGLGDQVIGGLQSAANITGIGDDTMNEYVTKREKEIEDALTNDPVQSSWFYKTVGISPKRLAGNIIGSPAGLAIKGASFLAKLGIVGANFAADLFTAPTTVEEGETFAGQKAQQAAAMALFMGTIAGTSKGFSTFKNNLISSDDLKGVLEGLDLPDNVKNNPSVIKTLRALKQNSSALSEAKNADEMLSLFKKYGIDAELNDVLGGAIQAQSAQARTTQATLDPKKIRDYDANKTDQLQGVMQKLKTDFSDGDIVPAKSEVGQSIKNEMGEFLKAEKVKAQEIAQPFYDKAQYGPNSQSKKFEAFLNSDNKMAEKIKPYVDVAFETIQQNRSGKNLPAPVYGSYETMLEARKLLGKDVDFKGPKILGGSSLEERTLKNAYSELNSFLKTNTNIKQGDEVYKAAFKDLDSQKIDKIVQIAQKSDENLATLSGQLFNTSTDIKQFKNITNKLKPETKKNLMNVFLDDITSKYTADTTMNRLFSNRQEQEKFMSLLSGDPKASKKLKALKDVDKIVKAVQSSRSVMTNSTTANKMVDITANDLQGRVGKLLKAISNGNGREVGSAIAGAAIGTVPIFEEVSLRMNKKNQDAFYDFIINPQNTEKFIKVMQRLNDIKDFKTSAQLKQYLRKSGIAKIPGASRVVDENTFLDAISRNINREITREVGRD